MAKRRISEFRQERIDFDRFHKSASKEVAPYFRKALLLSIKPTIEYAKTFGLEALSMALVPPITTTVWNNTYERVYNAIGLRMARKEYYRQRNLDATKASAISLLIDSWTSLLRDYALNYTYRIARELNNTTIEMIKKALGETLQLGFDEANALRLFEKQLNGDVKLRTGVISRTEATTISNLGKDIGARSYIDEQGGQGYKVWLGRDDEKERPTHIEENNTIIPIDDLHIVGGEACERPGDINLSAKERISCRCTESYLSETRYNAYVKRGRIVNGKLIGASGNRNS